MSETDYALIVGINRYPQLGDENTELNLQGPGNDADRMEAWFQSQKVQVLAKIKSSSTGAGAEPTRLQVEAALQEIATLSQRRRAERRGSLIGRRLYLYMTGHGFSPARRRGCFFTADADSIFGHNVYVSSWLDWFIDAGCFREFVLWMDCCMNRYSQMPSQGPTAKTLSTGIPPSGVFIAFAAQRPLRAVEVPIPQDGNAWHGAFTWALLEGLNGAAADANGLVTSRSLADWLRNAQARYLSPGDLASTQVSREPDIEEDSNLVFVRGVAPRTYPVTLSFNAALAGAKAQLWGGRPPAARALTIPQGRKELALRPGLYLLEVPSHNIRHGFEVVGPTEVAVAEPGPAVAAPSTGQLFALEIEPTEPSAEIFVIDTAFSLVDSAVGALSTPLPFGLYKVKVRVGNQLRERVVLLDQDRPPVNDVAPALAAAAPLPDSAMSHEYHQAAARAAAMEAQTIALEAKQPALMLMARTWSPARLATGKDPIPAGDKVFWNSVSVVDRRGKVVLDLAAADTSAAELDPFTVATVALQPGVYFLRRQIEDGTLREQSLVLTPGWTLEAYLLRQMAADASGTRSLFSLHMRQLGGDEPDEREGRTLEAAYAALADERHIFSAEMEEMIVANLRNPMLGIVGAHLLLLEVERGRRRDLSPLNTIIANLRALVGQDHPDVEALSLRCPDPELRTRQSFSDPPLFERSWRLIVEATQERPGIVRRALWNRIHALVPRSLYLAWVADKEIKEAALDALAKALWSEPATTPPAAAAVAVPTAAGAQDGMAAAFDLVLPEAAIDFRGMAVPEAAGPAAGFDHEAVDPKVARQRAVLLQVPLSVVNALRKR